MEAKKFPAMARVGMTSRLAGPARDQMYPASVNPAPVPPIPLAKIDHWSILAKGNEAKRPLASFLLAKIDHWSVLVKRNEACTS